MTDRQLKWRESMKSKYNVDDTGLSELMREWQKKSRRKGMKGGFSYKSKEELSELGKQGARKRWSG